MPAIEGAPGALQSGWIDVLVLPDGTLNSSFGAPFISLIIAILEFKFRRSNR